MGIIQSQIWQNKIIGIDWANNYEIQKGDNFKATLSAG